MSKIYSKDVRLIKKRGGFIKKLFIFLLIILTISVLIFGGVFLSRLITGTSFFNMNSNEIKLDKKDFYFITFGEFDSAEDCSEISVWVTNSGGAGYVYNDSGKYKIVAQVYNAMSDAENVIKNFPNNISYSANIMRLSANKCTINTDSMIHNDKKQLDNDIKYVFKIFERLLEISNNLDKGVLSAVNAGSKINSLKSEIKIINMRIKSINLANENNEKKLKNFNDFLIKYEDSLDVCINKLLTQENCNNAIKYCACEIAFNYINFVNAT